MPLTNIQQVIDELDNIINHCESNGSRQAFFAALYRSMTESVNAGIKAGMFQDAVRMEILDVIFANRYIDAWHCNLEKKPCSLSWKTAFDACNLNNLTVIQHLLLGINTHINLDLAIAAAETAPGESIFSLQTDFEKINNIISALTDEIQYRLEKVWWPMKFLRSIVNGKEKAVINFSITAARKASWANAVALASANGQASVNYVNGIDNTVNNLAKGIISPGFVANLVLTPVRWLEYKDVRKIIAVLKEPLTGIH
ncbi:hypothetical protein BH10BAC3_BH10BAC3_00540 [soil metagenome]